MYRILLTGKSGATQVPRCCRYFSALYEKTDLFLPSPEGRVPFFFLVYSSWGLAPSDEAAFMAAI